MALSASSVTAVNAPFSSLRVAKLLVLAVLALTLAPAQGQLARPTFCETDSDLDWTYDARCSEGALPPARWQEKYPDCGGVRQSPINLARDITDRGCTENLGDFKLSSGSCIFSELEYEPTHKGWEAGFSACKDAPYFTLTKNGKTGSKFKLAQYHLHPVAEHAIGGGYADAELHLVHINESNPMDAIVIGVRLEVNDGHAGNAELEKYWSHFALALAGDKNHSRLEGSDAIADPYAIVPASADYYHYKGSLTTPPCSEIVTWVVMKEKVLISPEELQLLRDALSLSEAPIVNEFGNTNRPLQPLNGRRVSQCTM